MAQNGHTFTLIRGASSLDITDLVNYSVVDFDGLGMAPVRRITQRGPLQNGDTDVDFRLDPRVIRLALLGKGSTDAAIQALRTQMVGFLRPGSDVIKLKWEGGGVERQIDTHYLGALSLPSADWRLNTHGMVVELRASDPTFYDPSGDTMVFSQVVGGTGMPFPLLVPMTFGASTLDLTQAVILSGDNAWETFPTIIITGPVTDLILTNGANGDKLSFLGSTIGGGVTYTIDLRYGYKTVVDHLGANQVSKLTTDSNLATWRLLPGSNSIRAVGNTVSSATTITIQWNQRYIGV